jgi:hypothetical protein
MNGIERIHITSDWKEPRLEMSRFFEDASHAVYKNIFASLNMPLLDGVEYLECTKEEAVARYDYQEGVDCILHFIDGTKATLQEKVLEYWESTVTVEERKVSGKPGAWYYCTAQYYFVAYATDYYKKRLKTFRDWMLVDFPALHRANLNWAIKESNSGRPPFRCVPFDDIPEKCVISRANHLQTSYTR